MNTMFLEGETFSYCSEAYEYSPKGNFRVEKDFDIQDKRIEYEAYKEKLVPGSRSMGDVYRANEAEYFISYLIKNGYVVHRPCRFLLLEESYTTPIEDTFEYKTDFKEHYEYELNGYRDFTKSKKG